MARRDAGACRRRTRARRLGRQLVRCHRFRRVHGSYSSFLAASLACRAGRAMERQASEVSPPRCCRAARPVILSAAVTGGPTPRPDRDNAAPSDGSVRTPSWSSSRAVSSMAAATDGLIPRSGVYVFESRTATRCSQHQLRRERLSSKRNQNSAVLRAEAPLSPATSLRSQPRSTDS